MDLNERDRHQVLGCLDSKAVTLTKSPYAKRNIGAIDAYYLSAREFRLDGKSLKYVRVLRLADFYVGYPSPGTH